MAERVMIEHLGGDLRTVQRSTVTATAKPGKPQRFIVTSAQNMTKVHDDCWDNLMALAKHYDAEVMVSRFKYMRHLPLANAATKPGQEDHEAYADPDHFDPRIEPYVCDSQVELAPGLVFCGELQISPTAVNPLSGLDGYTGRASSLVPHTKQFMQSVASGKNEGTKLIYTTGTVTLRNYIEARAGQKASFHHIYGGLLVEVCSDGTWFVRQLQADSSGVIHDLGLRVERGQVSENNPVEAIVWGDVHVAEMDPVAATLAWGERWGVPLGQHTAPMLDELRPTYQFFHDVCDWRARNGHTLTKGLHHDRFRDFIRGHESVEAEMLQLLRFLHNATREGTTNIIVNSNHDQFIKQWLRIGDYRTDPANAEFFLDAEQFMYHSLRNMPDEEPLLLKFAVHRAYRHQRRGANMGSKALDASVFLREDESFVICPDANGGIECGMHGHRGPNGARGSVRTFAKMGRKSITGHSHSAAIFEGAWQVGLMGKMDQGYNTGPSSWSHSSAIVYPNGKRAMVTMYGGKWKGI